MERHWNFGTNITDGAILGDALIWTLYKVQLRSRERSICTKFSTVTVSESECYPRIFATTWCCKVPWTLAIADPW